MLGFDGSVMSASAGEKLLQAAEEKNADTLVTRDLVGEIWQNRPPIPDTEVFLLEECYAGERTEDKLARVRTAMETVGADVHVLASLCDIAWLLNLRGNDIPGVPVVLSFLQITRDQCIWYVRSQAVTWEIRRKMSELGVTIRDYGQIYPDLETQSPPLSGTLPLTRPHLLILLILPNSSTPQ